MTSAGTFVGVLLAAGRGRRMGQTKQLIELEHSGGAKPMVAHAFDLVASVCERMVIVLGHDEPLVRRALAPRVSDEVLVDPDADMFESIRAGLALAERAAPEARGFWIHPADHPRASRDTLDMVMTVHTRWYPQHAVIPEYHGKGGHPILVPRVIADEIIKQNAPGGLRQFWRDHPERCIRLVVDDPRVTMDVDTPADLERLASDDAGR